MGGQRGSIIKFSPQGTLTYESDHDGIDDWLILSSISFRLQSAIWRQRIHALCAVCNWSNVHSQSTIMHTRSSVVSFVKFYTSTFRLLQNNHTMFIGCCIFTRTTLHVTHKNMLPLKTWSVLCTPLPQQSVCTAFKAIISCQWLLGYWPKTNS